MQCIDALGGNGRLNGQLLECNVDGVEMAKIQHNNCSQTERSNFIKNKYTFKMFVDHSEEHHGRCQQALWDAVSNNDHFGVLSALYHGADGNYQYLQWNSCTVLHRAVQRNHEQMVHLLVNNEVSANIEDGDEKLPNQIAIEMSLQNVDTTAIQALLKHAVF